MILILRIFFVANILLTLGNCYKILCVVPFSVHSHFTLGLRLVKELANRGNEVTFINAFPQKAPIKNLREILVPENIYDEDKKKEIYDVGQMSYIKQLKWYTSVGFLYTEYVLEVKEVQKLLKSNEKFDVVILEQFMNEAMMIFAHKFNCPLVLLAPGPTTILNNYLFSNPSPSSYVPNMLAGFSSHMTFWERLRNTYYDVVGKFFVHYVMLPTQAEILKRTVPGAPDLNDILYNSSLMLLTSHISLSDPIPLQPAIKEIGGYHIEPAKALSRNLQEFLDNAKEGVILFTMGSNIKSSHFPRKKREAILKVFSKLKQKVLWKYENDLPDKPNNVKIMSWLPQRDILGHPNIVGFITHVGLLGTTEAIYHGVPILGLPLFFDQVKNCEDAVRKGYGLKVNFQELNEENFGWALNELLHNGKYRENAKIRSKIMHNQPVKQIDEAVFWIEYVIRHKGALHLRSAGLDLNWYQKYLVDVLLFLVLIGLTCIVAILYLVRYLYGKIRNIERIKID